MKQLLILFISLFLFSCNAGKKKESGILPKEKMMSVIWDLVRVDEHVITHTNKDTTRSEKQIRQQLYLKVYKLHKVERNVFEESFKWYTSHPKEMNIILDSVQQRAGRISVNTVPLPLTPL